MFFSKPSILTIVALAGVSLAAPAISQRDTQSCHCSGRGVGIGAYGVYISVPYKNGVGCDNVYQALQLQTSAWPSSWKCVDAGDGNTQLYFDALLHHGTEINGALQSMYPNVQGGFNCPDY